MSWFGGLFGSAKPVLPTNAPKPAPPKGTNQEGENYTVVKVKNANPVQATPHPSVPTATTQSGGRRSVKARKAKGKKSKKSRSRRS
jgi:hypothetical protein